MLVQFARQANDSDETTLFARRVTIFRFRYAESPDAHSMILEANRKYTIRSISPYRFSLPILPHPRVGQ
jgi:hypothetical protein